MRLPCRFAVLIAIVTLSASARADAAFPDIREAPAPFPGVLYVPADGKPHPGVVVLHGSEGGAAPYARFTAQIFAHYAGVAALALCYFGCDDPRVPKDLFGVDLSKTYGAWLWLKHSEFVQDRKSGFYGVSRGAEQSILLASYLSEIGVAELPDALVVHAPYDRVVGGIPGRYHDPTCWTGGEAGASQWKSECGGLPGSAPAWNWNGRDEGLKQGSFIRIESYAGPLLVTHGTEDEVWEVNASLALESRLRRAGRAVSYREWRQGDKACGAATPDALSLDTRPPPSTGGATAEFDFFQCEGHVFGDSAADTDLRLAVDFLKRRLAP